MFYRVTIKDEVVYYLTKENAKTREEAIDLALQWFSERDPSILIEEVSPCQIDGICPYGNRACSDCRKELHNG